MKPVSLLLAMFGLFCGVRPDLVLLPEWLTIPLSAWCVAGGLAIFVGGDLESGAAGTTSAPDRGNGSSKSSAAAEPGRPVPEELSWEETRCRVK